jgi:hypothetical protein
MYYRIQEWRDRKIIKMDYINTKINPSDAVTKILGPQLHHRHMLRAMGYHPPSVGQGETPCVDKLGVGEDVAPAVKEASLDGSCKETKNVPPYKDSNDTGGTFLEDTRSAIGKTDSSGNIWQEFSIKAHNSKQI